MDIWSDFDLWYFLAGLGIFLFAMHLMEDAIRVLGGVTFKRLIRKYTATRWKAILSGMASTAVLQSSSAVSLMVLAFTGAGVMNLLQAISVMMGAKVGTTATAWLVAVFGFSFNIDSFSLPMIGVGGLGLILLAKSPRYIHFSRFLISFGLLFLGLDFMKESVEQLSGLMDPRVFAGYGIVVFALAGMILTAIMQSSSATIAIVLTMLHSNVVTFEAGAAMVVGATVGTTVTVLLGAFGGTAIKKRAAAAQLTFSLSTALVTLLLIPLLAWVVTEGMGFGARPVLGVAMFLTLFNGLGVLFFYPLIPLLAKNAERWFKEPQVQLTVYIHKTDPEVAEAGIVALRKEIEVQLFETVRFIRQKIDRKSKLNAVLYSDLESWHADIFTYYTRIHEKGLTGSESSAADELLRASRNLMNAAKNVQEALGDIRSLAGEQDIAYREAEHLILERIRLISETSARLEESVEMDITGEFRNAVEDLYESIEEMDKEFINQTSHAIGAASLSRPEITHLLMLNRSITQACRMVVFALRSLIKYRIEQTVNGVGGNSHKASKIH